MENRLGSRRRGELGIFLVVVNLRRAGLIEAVLQGTPHRLHPRPFLDSKAETNGKGKAGKYDRDEIVRHRHLDTQ